MNSDEHINCLSSSTYFMFDAGLLEPGFMFECEFKEGIAAAEF